MQRLLVTLLLLFGLASMPVLAQGLGPNIPKAVGAPHPEGNEYMRINHGRLLLHDREEAVRLGDRNIKYSLKQCVACHAVYGPDAKPVGYSSDKYFCRVCHDYAAVKIDCFTCHQSKPDKNILKRLLDAKAALLAPRKGAAGTKALTAYLKNVRKVTNDKLVENIPIKKGIGQ